MGVVNHSDFALVNAYVNRTIRAKDISYIEEKIGDNEQLRDHYQNKIAEHNFLMELIPNKKISNSRLKKLQSEISQITSDIIPESRISKLRAFLDKPIFTIKY